MKHLVIGAHLERSDVEPVADAIAVGDLFLSGVSIDDDQPLSDRHLLLRASDVRRQLLDRGTFIAIRYGFAISNAAEAARHCSPYLELWREKLTRHRPNVEMTLKVVAPSPEPRPERSAFSSGAEYLKALHAASRGVTVDDDFRAAAERVFAHAVENRWIHRDTASVEIAALVNRDLVAEIYEEGENLRARFPGVPFLLSGPWPLEVFAE